jgi:DNA-binding transcriptional regulator GbsR (MarR family)
VAATTARIEATDRFVERLASVLVESGWPRMAGRVFAALLASDSGRLTSAELSDVLHVSPAAVSGAVRYLAPLGLVSRERERGSRRDVYVVRDDQWHEATLRSDQMLARWEKCLREGMEALGPGTPAGARIMQSVAFAEFLQEEVQGMLERWRVRRSELERELSAG